MPKLKFKIKQIKRTNSSDAPVNLDGNAWFTDSPDQDQNKYAKSDRQRYLKYFQVRNKTLFAIFSSQI